MATIQDRLTLPEVADAVLTTFNTQDQYVDHLGTMYWIANRDSVEKFHGSNSGDSETWKKRIDRLNDEFATAASYALIGNEEAQNLYVADTDWRYVERELRRLARGA